MPDSLWGAIFAHPRSPCSLIQPGTATEVIMSEELTRHDDIRYYLSILNCQLVILKERLHGRTDRVMPAGSFCSMRGL